MFAGSLLISWLPLLNLGNCPIMRQAQVLSCLDHAAQCKGTSLNERLLQGQDQTSSLISVLLRFINGLVEVLADIKAMFYQVRVDPRDWDSLHFLWWPNNNLTRLPQEYQMQVQLLGATLLLSVCEFALKRAAFDKATGASVYFASKFLFAL